MRSAARLSRLGTESAYVVLDAARKLEAAGHRVVHLEIGEPDVPTAPHVIEAGIRALREGRTRYAVAAGVAGVPGCRRAGDGAARRARRRGERDHHPGREADAVLRGARADQPRRRGAVPQPRVPDLRVGGRASRAASRSTIRWTRRGAFAPDVTAIAALITPRTRVLILNLPHNPTGGMATPDDLARLATLAERHDLWVISDEVYWHITYGPHSNSIAALPGMVAADGDRGWLLEGLLDDRVAARLRGDAVSRSRGR